MRQELAHRIINTHVKIQILHYIQNVVQEQKNFHDDIIEALRAQIEELSNRSEKYLSKRDLLTNFTATKQAFIVKQSLYEQERPEEQRFSSNDKRARLFYSSKDLLSEYLMTIRRLATKINLDEKLTEYAGLNPQEANQLLDNITDVFRASFSETFDSYTTNKEFEEFDSAKLNFLSIRLTDINLSALLRIQEKLQKEAVVFDSLVTWLIDQKTALAMQVEDVTASDVEAISNLLTAENHSLDLFNFIWRKDMDSKHSPLGGGLLPRPQPDNGSSQALTPSAEPLNNFNTILASLNSAVKNINITADRKIIPLNAFEERTLALVNGTLEDIASDEQKSFMNWYKLSAPARETIRSKITALKDMLTSDRYQHYEITPRRVSLINLVLNLFDGIAALKKQTSSYFIFSNNFKALYDSFKDRRAEAANLSDSALASQENRTAADLRQLTQSKTAMIARVNALSNGLTQVHALVENKNIVLVKKLEKKQKEAKKSAATITGLKEEKKEITIAKGILEGILESEKAGRDGAINRLESKIEAQADAMFTARVEATIGRNAQQQLKEFQDKANQATRLECKNETLSNQLLEQSAKTSVLEKKLASLDQLQTDKTKLELENRMLSDRLVEQSEKTSTLEAKLASSGQSSEQQVRLEFENKMLTEQLSILKATLANSEQLPKQQMKLEIRNEMLAEQILSLNKQIKELTQTVSDLRVAARIAKESASTSAAPVAPSPSHRSTPIPVSSAELLSSPAQVATTGGNSGSYKTNEDWQQMDSPTVN